MRQSERSMCRPGGFALTERLIKMAGIGGRETLRVVDVGCGEGATIGYLRELHPGWEVSGIDADPAFCAAGMTETGRAESLPFPDGSIDVILMECSLSKTEQPERAAAEAFRVLKTGGWLLISDMYARRREILSDGGGMLGRLEGAHRIWKRLTEAGFSVSEMQDVSGELAQWVGQQIMDGNGNRLDQALGAGRKTLKEAGCGYFICAARPSALWELLPRAEALSPFYRRKFAEAGCMGIGRGDWERFRRIPFTTAEDIKEKPEDFLCVPAKEIARIITLKTSGSSGNPKRLFFTEEDLLATADFFETGMQYMVKPGDRVTVYMEGPGFYSIGGLLKEGLSRIGVEVTVHGLIRDMQAAARDGEGRDCFIGTAGQMYALAVEAPGLRPKSVLLSADYVPVSVKRFLENTWKCTVFTHWGMTETGYGGGVQCGAREGYHMRDLDLLLEVVDPETGEPVLDGELGELVLTTLRRTGMPLIRYRTGDLGRFIVSPCPCGTLKPRLAEVEGRLTDVISLSGGKRLSMHVLDELLLSSGIVRDFAASYDRGRNLLSVAVMAAGGEEEALEEAERSLNAYFEGAVLLEVSAREISPYIGSGKRKIDGIS